jgi:hypothetical protein
LTGGVAVVVKRKTTEDDFERVRFAFGELRSEDACAVAAVPELNRLEFFLTLPFLDNAGAGAVGAALGQRANDGSVSVAGGSGMWWIWDVMAHAGHRRGNGALVVARHKFFRNGVIQGRGFFVDRRGKVTDFAGSHVTDFAEIGGIGVENKPCCGAGCVGF